MKKFSLALLGISLLVAITASAQDAQKNHEPPMLGIHWAKGFAHGGGGSSPDMTSHGGTIMTNAATAAIFWGPGWSSPGDKITGMDTWYEGFGGSNYAGTSNEYTGTNGQVTSSVSYGGHFVDTTRASGGNSTSAILAEVCKMIPNPQTNGYYAVYTDLPRKGGYCAYHSWGACGGVNVQFAFFWKLDGDAGCDPQAGTTGGHSQGLAAIANVSGHELSEARTDPRGLGWFDSAGAENGDKCAWTFGAPSVTFKNGSIWKIQGEWSNKAYDSGTGYANSSGQKGCLSGK